MSGDCQLTKAQAYRELMADVYELAGASRRATEELAEEGDLTVARWNVLSVISTEDRTVPAIADRLGQTRQSVQAIVHELTEHRLAAVRPNPAHKRSSLVTITSSGLSKLDQANRAADGLRREQLRAASIDATELRQAQLLVRRLLTAIRIDA